LSGYADDSRLENENQRASNLENSEKTVKNPSQNARGPQIENETRAPNGRFTRGNPGGPGNPHAGQVAKLRAAILRAVDEGDIETIIAKLVEQAREGDLTAAREVLDRTIGKASQSDLLARSEALETIAAGLSEDRA